MKLKSKTKLLRGLSRVILLLVLLAIIVIMSLMSGDSPEVSSPNESTTSVEVIEDYEVKYSADEEVREVAVHNPVYTYTNGELDLLARLIHAEGGSESYDTQLKIGSVVMNRVDDPDFPDTIREVIYQPNQFSVTYTKVDGVIMIDRPADEEAKEAALEVLTYGSILPSKVQVFYEKSITSGWVASRQPYGTFDHTTFAYIYPRGELV